jgi:hypothetical protein
MDDFSSKRIPERCGIKRDFLGAGSVLLTSQAGEKRRNRG